MAETVRINLDFETTGNAAQGASKLTSALKAAEAQANRTREKMEKLANVGSKLALAGGALLAPLALATKKYLDTAKDSEAVSKRILELNQRWEQAQVRLGRIVATEVLPMLEKAAVYLDKAITFAEKNPGVVKAALTIGTTLVILGGLITTTAQLVSTVATIQGLAASAGLASVGGAAGAGGAAAAGGGVLTAAGMAGAVTAGLAAFFGVGSGIIITNAITGQTYTMTDLANTLKTILALNGKALDQIVEFFGGKSYFYQSFSDALGINRQQQAQIDNYIAQNQTNQTASIVGNAILTLANPLNALIQAIRGLFRGGRASGGYMSVPGLYAGAERGREYVLNAQTTRNAERAIGGRLTQQSAASYMTNNVNLANGMTIAQGRRIAKQESARVTDFLVSALGSV